MSEKYFTISFAYYLVPDSLKIDLSANVEMLSSETCVVSNVKRINETESSLLPPFDLLCENGNWVHSESRKESHLSTVISDAIRTHLEISPLKNKHKSNI